MKKTNRNLLLMAMIFAVLLITANVVSAKTFSFGITIFGLPVTCTVGAFCYAGTFLITDIVGEIWGKEDCKLFVIGGFVCQIISTVLIIALRYLPATDSGMQDAYVTLLGQNWLFVLASLTAYICSQSWDVFVFHKIRDKVITKTGSNKHRWIWNNVGTMTSQIIDTVIFVIIPFGFGFGWLFNPEMQPTLWGMMLTQYIIKFVLAALDTPIFYLLTTTKNNMEDTTHDAD
jgi:queuosine precursor transporter